MSERPGRGEPADAPACGEMRPALKKRGSDDKLEEAFARLIGRDPDKALRGADVSRHPSACGAAVREPRGRRDSRAASRIGSRVSSAGRRKASPTPRTGAWKCRRVENPARPRCARPPSEAVAAAHRQNTAFERGWSGRGATGNGPARPTRTAAVSRSRRISTSAAGREPAIMVLSVASRPRVRCRADRMQVAVARAEPGVRCDPNLKAGRRRPRPPPQAERSDRRARRRRGTFLPTPPRAAAHGLAQESACDPASERRIAPTSPPCQEWGFGGSLVRDQGSGPEGVPRPQFLQTSHPSKACRPLSGTPCSRRKLE